MRIAGPDNLLALGLTQSRLIDLITKNTLHFPAYRPVPYLTVWIQYRLNDAPRALISGNGIIMILCGVMLYLIVYRETQSPYIAAIAGVLLITEPRILPSYQWLGERQASLSALFGLIVMYLVMYNRSRYRFVGIGVFLLLSTLSKEYGLAFHVFTIVFLLMNKPDDYLKVGIATWWLRSYSFCCGDWSFEAL
jgi:hypothetical protein